MYIYWLSILTILINYSFATEIYTYKDNKTKTTIITNLPTKKAHKLELDHTRAKKTKVTIIDNEWLYKQQRIKLLQQELKQEQTLLKSSQDLLWLINREKDVMAQKKLDYNELYNTIHSSITIHQQNIQLLKNQLQ